MKQFLSAVAVWYRRLSVQGRRVVALGSGGLAILLVVAIVMLAMPGGSGHGVARGDPTTTQGTTPRGTPTPPPKGVVTHVCPLTGTPAPGGKVPQRPALAAKVGNDSGSRPQTGIQDADIVYEEMAEGGITRYMAIFQCKLPPAMFGVSSAIGPMRSVRWDDWHFLASYGHPILAFSGGIQPYDDAVANQSTNAGGGRTGWLFDGNGSYGSTVNAFTRAGPNVAPWNYFLDATEIWRMDPNHSPPPPQFVYSPILPKEAVNLLLASIHNFAEGSTVSWKWDGKDRYWQRYIGGQKDVSSTGEQYHATNVIIEVLKWRYGQYSESGGGGVTTNDVESIGVGSGTAYVLRNGKVEIGTWSCPSAGDVVAYHFKDGKVMTFEPGNTWVEVVPANPSYPITFQR
jgi:hypothetical protein